ncbi:MAG: efflux transporter outer membrane subunit [Bdellovibrionales bacterium]
MSLRLPFRTFVLITSVFSLVACAAGPDFATPEINNAPAYDQTPLTEGTASSPIFLGKQQRFSTTATIPAAWWHMFQSPTLNLLVAQTIRANPSLEAAQAALRSAQETAKASYSGFLPTLTGGTGATRGRSTLAATQPSSLYESAVGLTYVPDVFGATRRTVENLEALTEIKRFELEATRLSLTTNIALAAFQEASLRDQIAATEAIIQSDEESLDLLYKRFASGAIPEQTLLAQQSNLASSRAALLPLEQTLSQTRNMMATLLGQFPDGGPNQGVHERVHLTDFTLPQDLPLSLPSSLIEQRPDVLAALAGLKAANAKIGIATAAMLPQITLTGNYGIASAKNLFTPTTALWGLAAGLTQPLFEGGKLLHEKRASEAAFDESAATYRATVLAAFQNVADALKALNISAKTLTQKTAAFRTATQSVMLAKEQFTAGAISRLDVLNAEKTLHSTRIELAAAQGQRLIDTASLYQALGGGWWNQEQKTDKETNQKVLGK